MIEHSLLVRVHNPYAYLPASVLRQCLYLEVVVDKLQCDVDGDQRPRAADAGATVNEQRAGVVQRVKQRHVLKTASETASETATCTENSE